MEQFEERLSEISMLSRSKNELMNSHIKTMTQFVKTLLPAGYDVIAHSINNLGIFNNQYSNSIRIFPEFNSDGTRKRLFLQIISDTHINGVPGTKEKLAEHLRLLADLMLNSELEEKLIYIYEDYVKKSTEIENKIEELRSELNLD